MTRPIVRNGKQVGTVNKPDNQALLKPHDRFARMEADAERRRARLAREARARLDPDGRSQ